MKGTKISLHQHKHSLSTVLSYLRFSLSHSFVLFFILPAKQITLAVQLINNLYSRLSSIHFYTLRIILACRTLSLSALPS